MALFQLSRRHFATLVLAGAFLAAGPARAVDAFFNTAGLAIQGYDPVAYFTEGRPVHGSSEFTHDYAGARWQFASAANRDAFAADPARYAPQYGGYCAWAVSQGYTASTDPAAWRIEGDKLYLNYSRSVQSRWEKDIPGNITKADANWPGLKAGQ
ncbi:MAG: hypothetical protein Tsb0032_43530 [Kiloniellaceae bacterium]